MTTTQNINAKINTRTQRLTNEEIYDDIYFLVKDGVDEMLQRGGSYGYDFSNATNYTSDILNAPTNYWLVSLYTEDEEEFVSFLNDSVDRGSMDREVADNMIANYPRYLSIYWKNYKKMIKQAGFTRDVYLQRKWEIEEKIRLEDEANCQLL